MKSGSTKEMITSYNACLPTGPLLLDIANRFQEFTTKRETINFSMYSGVSLTRFTFLSYDQIK